MSQRLTGSLVEKRHKLSGQASVQGQVNFNNNLTINIHETPGVSGTIAPKGTLSGDVSYTTNVTNYEGEYEVTPTVDGKILHTQHRYMREDVTIHAIPFFEVSNPSGGNTIYIAGEIEIE